MIRLDKLPPQIALSRPALLHQLLAAIHQFPAARLPHRHEMVHEDGAEHLMGKEKYLSLE